MNLSRFERTAAFLNRARGPGRQLHFNRRAAIRAIEVKNNSVLHGKVISVMWSHRDLNARRSGIGNVFVKNLDTNLSEEVVEEKFSKFGKIVSFALAKDDIGNLRGFGFVNFESPDDARLALEAMNGSQLGIK